MTLLGWRATELSNLTSNWTFERRILEIWPQIPSPFRFHGLRNLIARYSNVIGVVLRLALKAEEFVIATGVPARILPADAWPRLISAATAVLNVKENANCTEDLIILVA